MCMELLMNINMGFSVPDKPLTIWFAFIKHDKNEIMMEMSLSFLYPWN